MPSNYLPIFRVAFETLKIIPNLVGNHEQHSKLLALGASLVNFNKKLQIN